MNENRNDQLGQERSSGQEQNQDSQENQGNLSKDYISSSANSTNEEDERDVSKQDEIFLPGTERSTKTPHAGSSTESNRDYNQNPDSNQDEV